MNRATREEWRELGFFYETMREPPRWRLVGSATGLARFVDLLDQYVADARNATLSEHEHYGPYMYLKVQTSESPAIDEHSIRGSLEDLARLRDLVAKALRTSRAGDSFELGSEYSTAVTYPLCFELREEPFDPASEDPQLSEPAV
jgi:hypothetical protein